MKRNAQTSLEFLTTYGWAFILIATIVGVIIFAFSPPLAKISFSTNDRKFLIKVGNITPPGGPDSVTLQLQNAAGDRITVTGIETEGDITNTQGETVRLNNQPLTAPIVVLAGGEMRITNLDAPTTGPVYGKIKITYKDPNGYSKTTTINASGTMPTTTTGGSAPAAFNCTIDNPNIALQSYTIPESGHTPCQYGSEEWYSTNNSILLKNNTGAQITLNSVQFWCEECPGWFAPATPSTKADLSGKTASLAMAMGYLFNNYGTATVNGVAPWDLPITVANGGNIDVRYFSILYVPPGMGPPGKMKITYNGSSTATVTCTGFPSTPTCT